MKDATLMVTGQTPPKGEPLHFRVMVEPALAAKGTQAVREAILLEVTYAMESRGGFVDEWCDAQEAA